MGVSVLPADIEAAPALLDVREEQSAEDVEHAVDTAPEVTAAFEESYYHVESAGRPHDWWWNLNNWRKRHAFAIFGRDFCQVVEAFLTSKYWLLFTVILTIFSLYAVDICDVAAGSVEARTAVSGAVLAIFILFCLELILSTIFVDKYLLSFFFWVDVIGTASLILDIQWFADSILPNAGSNALQITRAGRAARIGSQIGRITRVLRVIRLLRALKLLKVLQLRRRKVKGMEPVGLGNGAIRPTVLGELLAESTTRKCVIIILFVLIVATFLETVPPSAADYNRIQLLTYGVMSPQAFLDYAPYPVILLSYVDALNGSTIDYLPYTRQNMRTKLQLRTSVQCAKYEGPNIVDCGFENDYSTIWYDTTKTIQLNAGLSIVLTTVVIACLGLSAYFFGKDATTYVIMPIETMLKYLKRMIMVGADGDMESELGNYRKPPETDVLANYVSRLVNEIDNARWKAEEEARIADTLLNSMVPPRIARQLKELRWWEAGPEQRARTIADSFPHATVLFTDIVGFTVLSSRISAEDAMRHLNNMYTVFDEIVEKYGLYKVETIGDSYMLVGGAPEERMDHAERVAAAALEIRACVPLLREISGESEINVRIGMHSGAVTAGVVGFKNPRWHLFGDTCNTASRMESTGIAGEIQLSCTTYDLIRERFGCKVRGKIAVKGKGEMVTYLLERERGANKGGPDSPMGASTGLFPGFAMLGGPGEALDREAFLSSPQFKKAMERYTTARNSLLAEEEELCKLLKTLDDATAAGAARPLGAPPALAPTTTSAPPAAPAENGGVAAAAAPPGGDGVAAAAALSTTEAVVAAGVVVPRLAVGMGTSAFKQLVLGGATASDLKALAVHMHEELAMCRAMVAAAAEEKAAALRRDELFKLYGRVLETPGMTLRDTFTCILDSLYKIIECDVIKLYVVDHSRGQLWPANRHNATDANRTLPLDGTLVGSAVRRARAIRVDDVAQAREFNAELEELPAGYTSKSMMCVPVFSTAAGLHVLHGPTGLSHYGHTHAPGHHQPTRHHHGYVHHSHPHARPHTHPHLNQGGTHHDHPQRSPPAPASEPNDTPTSTLTPAGHAPPPSGIPQPSPGDVVAVLVAVNRWTSWDEAGTEEGERRIVPFGGADEAAVREAAACVGLLLMRRRGEMLLASAAGLGGLAGASFTVAALPASVARQRLRTVARRSSTVFLDTRTNLWALKQEELMGQARDVLSALQRRIQPVSLLGVLGSGGGGVGEEVLVSYLVRIAGDQACGRFFNLAHSVGVLQGIYLTLRTHNELALALGPQHLLALVLAASLLNIIREAEVMPAGPTGTVPSGAAGSSIGTPGQSPLVARTSRRARGASGVLSAAAAGGGLPPAVAAAPPPPPPPEEPLVQSTPSRKGRFLQGSLSWRRADPGVIAEVVSAASATAAFQSVSRRWSRRGVGAAAAAAAAIEAVAEAPSGTANGDHDADGGSGADPGGARDATGGSGAPAQVEPAAATAAASSAGQSAQPHPFRKLVVSIPGTAAATGAGATSSPPPPPSSQQQKQQQQQQPTAALLPGGSTSGCGGGSVAAGVAQPITHRSRAVSVRRGRLAAVVDDIFSGESNLLESLSGTEASAVKTLIVTLLALRTQPAAVLAMPSLSAVTRSSSSNGTAAGASGASSTVAAAVPAAAGTAGISAFANAAGATAAASAALAEVEVAGTGATPSANGDVSNPLEGGAAASSGGGGNGAGASLDVSAAAREDVRAVVQAVTEAQAQTERSSSRGRSSPASAPAPYGLVALLQKAGRDPARLTDTRTAVCALLLLTWSELLHIKDTNTALSLLKCRAADVRSWASRLTSNVSSKRRSNTLMGAADDTADDIHNLLLLEIPRMQLEVIPLWQRTVDLIPALQTQLDQLQANRATYISLLQSAAGGMGLASTNGGGGGIEPGVRGGVGSGGDTGTAAAAAAGAAASAPLSPSGFSAGLPSPGGGAWSSVTTRASPSSLRLSRPRVGGSGSNVASEWPSGGAGGGSSGRDPRCFISVKHRVGGAARSGLAVVPSGDSGEDIGNAAAAAGGPSRSRGGFAFGLPSYTRASSSRSYAGRGDGGDEYDMYGGAAVSPRAHKLGLISSCVGGSLRRTASRGGSAMPTASALASPTGTSRLGQSSASTSVNANAVHLTAAGGGGGGGHLADQLAEVARQATSGSVSSFVGIGIAPARSNTRPRMSTQDPPVSPTGEALMRRGSAIGSRLNTLFTSFRASGRMSRLQLPVSDGSPVPATGTCSPASTGPVTIVLGLPTANTLGTTTRPGPTAAAGGPGARGVLDPSVSPGEGGVVVHQASWLNGAGGPGAAAASGAVTTSRNGSGGGGLSAHPSQQLSYRDLYPHSGGASQVQSPSALSPVTSFRGAGAPGPSLPQPPPQLHSSQVLLQTPEAGGPSSAVPYDRLASRASARGGLRAKIMLKFSNVAAKLPFHHHQHHVSSDPEVGSSGGGSVAFAGGLPYSPSGERERHSDFAGGGGGAGALIPTIMLSSSMRRCGTTVDSTALEAPRSPPRHPPRTSAPTGALALAQEHAQYAATVAAAAKAFAAARQSAAAGGDASDQESPRTIRRRVVGGSGSTDGAMCGSGGGAAGEPGPPMMSIMSGLTSAGGLSPVAEFTGLGRTSSATGTPRTGSTLAVEASPDMPGGPGGANTPVMTGSVTAAGRHGVLGGGVALGSGVTIASSGGAPTAVQYSRFAPPGQAPVMQAGAGVYPGLSTHLLPALLTGAAPASPPQPPAGSMVAHSASGLPSGVVYGPVASSAMSDVSVTMMGLGGPSTRNNSFQGGGGGGGEGAAFSGISSGPDNDAQTKSPTRSASKGVWLGLRLASDALRHAIGPSLTAAAMQARSAAGSATDLSAPAASTVGGSGEMDAPRFTPLGHPVGRRASSTTTTAASSQQPSRMQTPVTSLRRGASPNLVAPPGVGGVASLQAVIDMAEAALAGGGSGTTSGGVPQMPSSTRMYEYRTSLAGSGGGGGPTPYSSRLGEPGPEPQTVSAAAAALAAASAAAAAQSGFGLRAHELVGSDYELPQRSSAPPGNPLSQAAASTLSLRRGAANRQLDEQLLARAAQQQQPQQHQQQQQQQRPGLATLLR